MRLLIKLEKYLNYEIINFKYCMGHKERKKIYKFLISKNIEGLEIAPKLFLHNHKNFKTKKE